MVRGMLGLATLAGALLWGAAVPAAAGDEAAETVWKKGVAYLLGAQDADGSWGNQRGKVGVTGIALEALILAPAALQDDAVRAARAKAADYLAANQQTEAPYDGAVFEAGAGVVGTYCTSIAVVALTQQDREKYAPAIAKAVHWLKRQQASEDSGYDAAKQPNAYGGFAYGSGGNPRASRPDLSNTWMALDALKASGLVADDDPVWARAKVFVQRCQNATEVNDQPWASDAPDQLGSGVYYPTNSPAGNRPDGQGGEAPRGYGSMTYAMLLSYLWLDMKKDEPAVKLALDWLAKHYSVDENPNTGQAGLYYYYRLMAKALAANGEAEFAGHDWRKELVDALVKRQREDGSFVNAADRWGETDPELVTAYSLTTLGLAQETPKR